MTDQPSERLTAIAKAVAFQILDDYEEDDVEFSITSSFTEGNTVHASGEDESGERFELVVEVRFK